MTIDQVFANFLQIFWYHRFFRILGAANNARFLPIDDFNKNPPVVIRLMSLNRVKLGRTATFNKYLANVVSLIFLTKYLIWNKITFLASNTLNLAELMANEPTKVIYKTFINIPFLFDILLNVKILRAYN